MRFICTDCGNQASFADDVVGLCTCGFPLEVHYDWEDSKQHRNIDHDDQSLWRYSAVLPQVSKSNRITLGEGFTTLSQAENGWGIDLYIKDETGNPTGSFKDRGMALAVSMAKEQGVQAICLPSAGNAGIAAAAYCRKAGIQSHVFLPQTIPNSYLHQTERYAANVYLQGNSIADAGKHMLDNKQDGWFDISTLKEPYRVEGKKTMGYEIAEQLGWRFPDAVIYPTGGGTGLIGMWKAFNEMKQLGWVDGSPPRMVCVQSSGCAPVSSAFEAGESSTQFWDSDITQALGLNVPGPIGGAWMLRILDDSGGTAITVSESDVAAATADINAKHNLNASYEAGVLWLGLEKLAEQGWLKANQTVVAPITGVHR